ncbi:MAG: hypothetical protein P1P84_21035 [Deferrisomatales bacterium]|nr:hypothetical protein [Deferrisomatales bacterium]
MSAGQANPRKHPKADRARLRERTRQLRKELTALDYLASGSLVTRTKSCGKPNCRCATDPAARHGPYYEWGRMRDGKLVHTSVTREQATLLERAIDNQRRAKALLNEWEQLTEAEILKPEAVSDD